MSGLAYKPTQEEFEADYPIDFGSGVRGNWYSQKEIQHAGLLIAHLHADGELCVGSVGVRVPKLREAEQWRLVSEDPLTLEPSISSSTCELHGWIRRGKWVNA